MRRQFFESGEKIFQEGEPSGAAYVIVSGEVEIIRSRKGHKSTTMAVLGKGEYVGEMGAIDDRPRSATAVAKGPVVCMSVTREEFMDMLVNRPEESIELLKILFDRLRHANEMLALAEQDEEE